MEFNSMIQKVLFRFFCCHFSFLCTIAVLVILYVYVSIGR